MISSLRNRSKVSPVDKHLQLIIILISYYCCLGARAYYMRNICHDWSDEQCHTILTNTAKAMEKGYSRLLIDDYVLPNTGAPVRGSSMDILMMMYASGMERMSSQWEKVLDSSGLEIIKIWGTDSDHEQVIETQLKT